MTLKRNYFLLEFPLGKLEFFLFQTTITTTNHRRRSCAGIEKNSKQLFLTLLFFLSFSPSYHVQRQVIITLLRFLLLFFFACATCYCEQNMQSLSYAAITVAKVAFPFSSFFGSPLRIKNKPVQTSPLFASIVKKIKRNKNLVFFFFHYSFPLFITKRIEEMW